jgi:molybdopterin converting factor small subunit
VPVTAKLSRQFYDRLGDQVANELVEWFNSVDATYRAELRELNEGNALRFDAKIEQRISELEAKLDNRISELETRLDKRIAELDARLGGRIDRLEQEMHALREEVDRRLGLFEERIEARLAKRLTEHLRWQFVTWAALMTAVVGLWFR